MEMKRAWTSPKTEVQLFDANEYVAACYAGECNITGDDFHAWSDVNGNGTVDDGELGGYVVSGNTACDHPFDGQGEITLVAGTGRNGEFVTGYYFEQYKWVWFPIVGWQYIKVNSHVSNNVVNSNAPS